MRILCVPVGAELGKAVHELVDGVVERPGAGGVAALAFGGDAYYDDALSIITRSIYRSIHPSIHHPYAIKSISSDKMSLENGK